MPSDNQTFGDRGGEFECDSTQRTATLRKGGGKVSNVGSADAFINLEADTVVTTQPAGVAGRCISAGGTVELPITCRAFTFKMPSGSTNLMYEAAR